MNQSDVLALTATDAERLQVRILGIVQGVGFRPFVYRLATELDLTGWICNDDRGVTLEVEGPHASLLQFLEKLQKEKPPPAYLYALDARFLAREGYTNFEIRKSRSEGSVLAWVLPDLGICEKCRKEILDSANRRYRYPFTNCTHCGPRFTILEGLPYDRPATTMKDFRMCDACESEYHQPEDRRFHAQPNACSSCGPQLRFRPIRGPEVPELQGPQALSEAVEAIRQGKIVAVKGIGGFHLMLDARNESAVAELRRRKRRQNKPLAVMYPDIESLQRHVETPAIAISLLQSPQAPIVLLPRTKAGAVEIAPSVAPHSPYLGVFLPYTPLHTLLLQELQFPVVATSGNLSDEPIEFRDGEAGKSLSGLCDSFLTNDRPIARQADDSVLQIVTHPEVKPQILRRARGYAPMPLLATVELPALLALGGHLNSTFAVSRNREIILSQHLGDMESYESRQVYRQTLHDFLNLYGVTPRAIVHDMHPDYFTTGLAEEFGLPRIAVQHHHAHLAACLLENQVNGPVLGLTWDGTGYGTDHTIWGGEFLLGNAASFQRVATLFPFMLPGGEKGIKETWRIALSLLKEAFGNEVPRALPLFRIIPPNSIDLTLQMMDRRVNCPVTTSIGRLFDGVSAILGLSYFNTHQAESAQMLEYAAWRNTEEAGILPLPLIASEPIRLDWRELIRSIVSDFQKGVPAERLSASFHATLADAAIRIAHEFGISQIAMSGGVFCNRYLTQTLLAKLKEEHLEGIIHSQLPPTDGSLAAGQLWVAAQKMNG